MTFLFCLLLAAAGLILFLLSVWWEHDFSKRAAGSLSDGKVDDRTLEDLQREHKIIEWVRVAGAIGLLIGLVLPMFVGR
jgi:hypothetical protein